MQKHNLKIGDNVFGLLVPSDSGMSIIPLKVFGILDDKHKNAMTLNSEIALKYWGRDHDIDQISIMVNDRNWQLRGALGEPIDGFNILWNTLASHGFHEGKPKDTIIAAKELMKKKFKEAKDKKSEIGIKRSRVISEGAKDDLFVELPDFDILARETDKFGTFGTPWNKIFKNVFKDSTIPVTTPLNIDYPIASRTYFGNKKIDVAASQADKISEWYNSSKNKVINAEITIPEKLVGALKDAGLKGKKTYDTIKFKIELNQDIYDALLPYFKENTVDNYNLAPKQFMRHSWLSHALINDITFNGENFAQFGDLQNDEIVQVVTSAFLTYAQRKFLNGKNVQDIFKLENNGYEDSNSRSRVDRALSMYSGETSGMDQDFAEAVLRVLRDDFEISIPSNRQFKGSKVSSDYEEDINNSLDRLMSSAFESLYYDQSELMKFGYANTEYTYPQRSMIAKLQMQLRASAALESMFYFDDALPMNMLANSVSVHNNGDRTLSEYSKYIDSVSSIAYEMLTMMDADWANYDKFRTKRREGLQKYYTTFNEIETNSKQSGLGNQSHKLITSALSSAMFDTFIKAEVDSPYRGSLIYETDNSGKYIYEDKPFQGFFMERDGKDKLTTKPNLNIKWENGNIDVRFAIRLARNSNGSDVIPMMQLVFADTNNTKEKTVEVINLRNLTTELPKILNELSVKYSEINKESFDNIKEKISNDLYETLLFGGHALDPKTTPSVMWGKNIIGQRPVGINEKQGLVRKLYSNAIEKMAESVFHSPQWQKQLSKLNVPDPYQYTKDIVAGAVLALPLESSSWRMRMKNEAFANKDDMNAVIKPLAKYLQEKQNVSKSAKLAKEVTGIDKALPYGIHETSGLGYEMFKAPSKAGFGNYNNIGMLLGYINTFPKMLNLDMKNKLMSLGERVKMLEGYRGLERVILEDMITKDLNNLGALFDQNSLEPKYDVLLKMKKGEKLPSEGKYPKDFTTGNNKPSYTPVFGKMEELPSNLAFLMTELGAGVYDDLKAKGITPSLRYVSKGHGETHDVFDVAKDMINTIYDTKDGKPDYSNVDQYDLTTDGFNSLMYMHKQVSKYNPYHTLGSFTNALLRFSRQSTTINKRMMGRLNNFLADRKYSDGTAIEREHIFNPKGLSDDKVEYSQSAFKDFMLQEFADAAGLDSLGKKKLKEEWASEGLNMTNEDYIERLAVKQLENISYINARIINEALKKGKIDSKAFYNTYAGNISEMYHVIKNYSKQKKQFERNKNSDMTAEQANRHVTSALKMNVDIRHRTTPRILSSLLSSQRVLVNNTILQLPRVTVVDGKLDTVYEPVLLQNENASPDTFRGNTDMALNMRRSVTTGEMFYDIANKMKEISDINDRALNEITEHITEEYKSNSELEVLEIEKELSKIGAYVEQALGDNFSIEYGEQNGVVFPKITFTDGKGNKLSAGITGEKTMTWSEFKSQFKRHLTNQSALIAGGGIDFTKGDKLSKAVDVYLSSKLLAAQQASVAKHYNEIAVSLSNMLIEMGDISYANKFKHALSQLTLVHDLGNLGEKGNVLSQGKDIGNVLKAAGLYDTRYLYMPSISMDSNQLIERFREALSNAKDNITGYLSGTGVELNNSTKGVINMLMMMFNVNKASLSGKYGKKTILNLLQTADGWAKRQQSMEDTSLNLDKDMLNAINKIELNPKNKLFGEIIAMFANDFNTRPITLEGMRRMNDLIGSIYQKTSYDLLQRMYEMTNQDMNRFHRAFNTDSTGHIDENPIVYNEINHLLRHLKGESFIFTKQESFDDKLSNGTPVRITYRVDRYKNPLQGISSMDNRHNTIPDAVFTDATTSGYVVEHTDNDMLIWNASSNNYFRIKRADVRSINSGLAPDNITQKYLDHMTAMLGQDMQSQSNKIRSLLYTKEQARASKDFEAVNKVSEMLGQLSKEWKVAMANDNTGLQIAKLKNKVSGFEAMLNYQGVGRFLTSFAGLTGGIATGIIGIAGSPVMAAASPLLFAFAGQQFYKGVLKATKNSVKNFTSAAREHLMMFGVSKTISDGLNAWKEQRSDSQSATVSKVTTFSKDEIEMKQTIGDAKYNEIDKMHRTLMNVNTNLNDKAKDLLNRLSKGELSRDDLHLLAERAIMDNIPEKDENGIDQDLVDYYKHVTLNTESGEFAFNNGYSLAILDQMRRNLMKEKVTTLVTFGRLVSRTEEPARRYAEKALGSRLEKEGIIEGASSSEIRNYVNDIMNVAIGEYSSQSKLNWNKSGLPALMRLYERFNRHNTAYYLDGIWQGVDKALSIEELSKEFSNYGLEKNKYSGIKHIDVHDYEVSNVTTGYNLNELTRLKRKLTWTAAVSLTSKMALSGLAYAVALMFNDELARKLYKHGSKVTAFKDFNDSVEFSGALGGIMDASIATLTASLVDMDYMVKHKIVPKQSVGSILKDEIGSYDKILQSAGVGFGYSNIMDLPFNIGMSFYLYKNRSHKFYQDKLDTEMANFWGRQIETSAKLSRISGVVLNTGDLGLELIGSMMKDGYSTDKLAQDIFLDKLFTKRKKATSAKKKKKKSDTEEESLFNLSDIFAD